jgi:DNA-directed RNA polymerase subunit RPC12/RpoP
MDINFKCRHCDQDLSVDASAAGSEIQCPACGGLLVIPAAHEGAPPPRSLNPIATSAAAREEKHFAVPVHDKPAESLIAKPLKPLDAAAKEGITIRVKTIRHSDCVEVGKDHFDEFITAFLNKIGEANVVKIETFNYSHKDLETREWVTDYGVMIVFHG